MSDQQRKPDSCFTQAQQVGDHNHHHHHHHDGECDHPTNPGDDFIEDTLFPYIDTPKLRCDNEFKKGAIKSCFKPYHERYNTDSFLQSGVDPQLLLFIPFTVAVRVKSITLLGGMDGTAPSKMKIFKNRADIDFSNAENAKSEQDVDLIDYNGKEIPEYAVKQFKFQNVNSLTLYIPSNYGADRTRIFYIGIKGEATTYKKQIVHAVYESKPQVADHKSKSDEFVSKQIQ